MDAPCELHPDKAACEEPSVFEYPADADEDSSVRDNENRFSAGLLTQPCDNSVDSEVSYDAQHIIDQDSPGSKGVNDRPAVENGVGHAVGSTPIGKSPSAENASKILPCLNERYEYDPYLLAQSKKLFSASFERNMDMSGSSSDDDENSDDSEFARSLNLGNLDHTNGLEPAPVEKRQQGKQKVKISSQIGDKAEEDNNFKEISAKRGMIFSTHSSNKKPKKYPGLSQPEPGSMLAHSISHELEAKYPCRSLQIKVLSSQLESVVRKTILAWRSMCCIRNNHYSEASFNGEVKLSSPAPVIVSGSGGTGKTSIVCDAVDILREKTDSISGKAKSNGQTNRSNIVSRAYVDCASYESTGDVAFILNSAFKQLHDCYYPKAVHGGNHDELASNDGCDDKGMARSEEADQDIFPSNLMNFSTDHIEEIHDSDDDDFGVEDFIERQRKSFRVKHFRKGRNGSRLTEQGL
ncbi:hypothetical protein HJC23_000042 [Cyclotella cryptica]|uniref:Uncharacterized protein n=1 Tax=Cyclotella cryptica TaxID=29204 RepID=A0ABD3NVP5_9STRA